MCSTACCYPTSPAPGATVPSPPGDMGGSVVPPPSSVVNVWFSNGNVSPRLGNSGPPSSPVSLVGGVVIPPVSLVGGVVIPPVSLVGGVVIPPVSLVGGVVIPPVSLVGGVVIPPVSLVGGGGVTGPVVPFVVTLFMMLITFSMLVTCVFCMVINCRIMLFISCCSCVLKTRVSASFRSDAQITPTAAGSLAFSSSFSTTENHVIRSPVKANA